MNLPNLPFELIFILLFFAAPLLSRVFNRGRPQDGAPTRTARPTSSRPTSSRPTSSQPTQPRPGAAPSAESREAGDALSRRLEEARRRVQEAMTEGGGGGGDAPRNPGGGLFTTPARTAQTPAQAPARPPQRRTSARGLEGRSLEGGSLEGRGLEGRGLETRTPELARALTGSLKDTDLADAPPLRVQRLGRAGSVTIFGREDPLSFDREAIMRGFIWHQVLSPPLAKQPRRTPLSRR